MLDTISFLFYWIGKVATYLFSIELVPGVPFLLLILVASVIIYIVTLVTGREED